MIRSFLLFALLPVFSLLPTIIATASPLPDNLQRVGSWSFGPSLAVDVDPTRGLIFLSSGGVVLILDGTDPTNPTLINDEIRTVGLVSDLFYDAADQDLYIAGGEGGLEIWDVSTPEIPLHLSTTEVLYVGVETPVRSVEVYQNTAVTENSFGYVHSLDVTDPTHPVEISFNGVMGNPSHEIHISQEDGQVHATGAQYYVRLAIFPDGSLHSSGQKGFTYGAGAIFGTPEIAYVGYGSYLYILDLLLSGFPTWATINTNGVTDLVVDKGLAYLINGGGFRILDVSIPNSPTHKSVLPLSPAPQDIALAGHYAYVATRIGGLVVIDIADPENPYQAGSYDAVFGIAWQTEVVGQTAYVANSSSGLTILDLSDLTRPEHLSHTGSLGETRDVAVQGHVAYVADWTGGLRIFDVLDPSQPNEIGTVNGIQAWRLLVDGDLVYLIDAVANERDYLRIYDISDPTMPTEIGSLHFQQSEITWEMLQYGDILYVAENNAGIRIVDISDPTQPVEVDSYPMTDVTDLAVVGSLLCVASFDGFSGGLFLFDIRDPLHPTYVGSLEQAGFSPFHVDVIGDFVYTNDFNDFHLIDISNPSHPVSLETYTTPGGFTDVAAHNQYVFISDAEAGVLILENLLYEIPAGLEDDPFTGGSLRFLPATPNPFASQTGIHYQLSSAGHLRIDLFATTGRKVRTLVDRAAGAGSGSIVWDGRDDAGREVPGGFYFGRLRQGDGEDTIRLIRLR